MQLSLAFRGVSLLIVRQTLNPLLIRPALSPFCLAITVPVTVTGVRHIYSRGVLTCSLLLTSATNTTIVTTLLTSNFGMWLSLRQQNLQTTLTCR